MNDKTISLFYLPFIPPPQKIKNQHHRDIPFIVHISIPLPFQHLSGSLRSSRLYFDPPLIICHATMLLSLTQIAQRHYITSAKRKIEKKKTNKKKKSGE